jgi:hypothetical protein
MVVHASPRPTVVVGLAGLVDAGRVWAGDAPFGVNSRTSIGAGIGLLLSRVESRRLWRLDLAVPTRPDAHASWEVRLSSLRTRSFWREPGDVSRARAGVAPSAIFTWH